MAAHGRRSGWTAVRHLVLASLLAALVSWSISSGFAPPGGSVGTLQAESLIRWAAAVVGGGPFAVSPLGLRRVLYTPDGAKRPIVVIAPHMDDESLFCGETIAGLREQGFEVTVVFTTSSQGGRKMDPTFEADRHMAYARVAGILDVSRTFISVIPDGAPLGGEEAKAQRTEAYVRQTGAVVPGCVLFTIGGGGHYDHRIAEVVGRRLAREMQLPLFIYWGYGPHAKWHPASDKNWGVDMRPSDLAGPDARSALEKKRRAIETYRATYFADGWAHYWVSIGPYEEYHSDEVGLAPRP